MFQNIKFSKVYTTYKWGLMYMTQKKNFVAYYTKLNPKIINIFWYN